MRVPAAVAAVPLLAGAAAGVLFVDSIPERLILAFAATSVFALLAGCGFLAEDLPWMVVATVTGGCAAAGVSMGASTARSLYEPSLLRWFEVHAREGEPVAIEGVLREDGALADHGAVVTIAVDRVALVDGTIAKAVEGGVRLAVGGSVPPADLATWRAGRRVRAPALLRPPTTFNNPGADDEIRAQARRGIALTGTIKSAALIDVRARGSLLDETAATIRARIRRIVSAQVGRYDERSAAVATAIVIGDRSGLSDEDEQRLRDAGTYHVIAISGGNIAILTALLMASARLLRVPHRTAALLAIAVLLFYGEIAGGSASVGRAITAAVIFLSAYLFDHRGSPLNTLAVAGLLGVALAPAVILDAGFLLSFGATAGIILGVPRLVRPWTPPRTLARRVTLAAARASWTLLAATICAEIALVPLAALLFSRVTAAGLLLNFAAIPLMTLVQTGAMALLFGTATSGWGAPIALVVHRAATGLLDSSHFVDAAPWLVQDVPKPALWLCGTYYVAAAAVLARPARRVWRRTSSAALIVAAAAILGGLLPRDRLAAPPGTLRVVVLDVGQGDATVAILPDGTSLLVDAGGLAGATFDIGGRVVAPALSALGVRRLHALVITHGDPDHVGGAQAVIERFRPRSVWEGVPVPPLQPMKQLAARAAARHIVWRTVRPGDVDRAGGVEIRVLHPPAPDWERQRVRNDDSVVLELRYGDVSILLPGDIGQAIEHALAPSLDLRPLVVLKAPHHGSATSSSEPFLDAVHPRVVIFSAGRNNRYGHPAPVVVERYARRGVEMFNTAEHGAVFVETDGKSVEVRGWRGKSAQAYLNQRRAQ